MVAQNLKAFVLKCLTCCKNFQIATEPLITTEFPSRPWVKVASDLHEFKGASYIVDDLLKRRNSVQLPPPVSLLLLNLHLLITTSLTH